MRELSEDEFRNVTELILAGQKIPAFKLYRESTGAGLVESKDFVDNLEKQLREENAEGFNTTVMPGSISLPAMPEEDAKQMTDLIFAGQKIQAIKMYRAASRLGLKESKDFIDELEKQLRAECPENFAHVSTSGCLVVLVGGLLALAVATQIIGWV